MEKFTVTKFTVVKPHAVIVHLAMCPENRRRCLSKIRVAEETITKDGFEVRGINVVSGARVRGYFADNGQSWVAYS